MCQVLSELTGKTRENNGKQWKKQGTAMKDKEKQRKAKEHKGKQ